VKSEGYGVRMISVELYADGANDSVRKKASEAKGTSVTAIVCGYPDMGQTARDQVEIMPCSHNYR